MSELPENLVGIGTYATAREAHERGLVVLSQGASYWVQKDLESGSFNLLAEGDRATHLEMQIEIYERESVNWPPKLSELPEEHPGSYAAMTWIAVLILTYLIQLRWPGFETWGIASSEAIRDGQFYRCFTALFLHGDIGHLSGNLLFGAVMIHFIARHTGTLTAWFGVLLSGFVGNYLNAVLYFGMPHYSIGASTAVFGAIGMLVCLPVGFAIRHDARQVTRYVWIPVIVGIILLAWFGTGSERTDTSAHLTGFLCGVGAGCITGLFMKA